MNHLFVGESILHKRRTRSSRRLIQDEFLKQVDKFIDRSALTKQSLVIARACGCQRWLQLPRLALLQSCRFHGFRHSGRLSTASTGLDHLKGTLWKLSSFSHQCHFQILHISLQDKISPSTATPSRLCSCGQSHHQNSSPLDWLPGCRHSHV